MCILRFYIHANVITCAHVPNWYVGPHHKLHSLATYREASFLEAVSLEEQVIILRAEVVEVVYTKYYPFVPCCWQAFYYMYVSFFGSPNTVLNLNHRNRKQKHKVNYSWSMFQLHLLVILRTIQCLSFIFSWLTFFPCIRWKRAIVSLTVYTLTCPMCILPDGSSYG